MPTSEIADPDSSGSRTAPPGPKSTRSPSIGKSQRRLRPKLRKEHWAWQPLRDAARCPPCADAAWPRDDDRSLPAGPAEAKGLKPVGDADRLTLIRRVTFDLTGLPPTLAEIDAFLARLVRRRPSSSVVDRLLASPAFGERWGRHWLDVARYGESTGSSRNLPYPHAWRYRDYVIDAFNHDKPYDRVHPRADRRRPAAGGHAGGAGPSS